MATNAASVLVFLLVAPIAVYGATITVDWNLGNDYSSYASKDVSVGDSIVFTYDSSHSVLAVSKSDYSNCVTSNPTFSDNSGSTTYPLTTAGAVYFICGTLGHCPGMQLQLNVKAASSSTPATPSTPASPPSSSTTPSPTTPSTDSPTTPSSSPPPPPPTTDSKNGAASGGLSWLVFGASLVFGPLLMC